MLDEYKEIFRQCADAIDGWKDLSKNELCRKYVENTGNPLIQNSYFSAIMYRYWNLIGKYYYMSSNVASPEDCYEWLEDSVYGCLKATSWDRIDSSIYKDPNGPDKVINRCMKCARLTYYQYINRKKRKDNFGLLSLDEMKDLFGTTVIEPYFDENEEDVTSIAIQEYVYNAFYKKDYFLAILIDVIQSQDVFEVDGTSLQSTHRFSLRKITKVITTIDDVYIKQFSDRYLIPVEDVITGINYFIHLKPPTIRAKIQTALERLQHDSFFKSLHGGA